MSSPFSINALGDITIPWADCLVVGCFLDTVPRWEVLYSQTDPQQEITCAAISPDGLLLCIGGSVRVVETYNRRSRAEPWLPSGRIGASLAKKITLLHILTSVGSTSGSSERRVTGVLATDAYGDVELLCLDDAVAAGEGPLAAESAATPTSNSQQQPKTGVYCKPPARRIPAQIPIVAHMDVVTTVSVGLVELPLAFAQSGGDTARFASRSASISGVGLADAAQGAAAEGSLFVVCSGEKGEKVRTTAVRLPAPEEMGGAVVCAVPLGIAALHRSPVIGSCVVPIGRSAGVIVSLGFNGAVVLSNLRAAPLSCPPSTAAVAVAPKTANFPSDPVRVPLVDQPTWDGLVYAVPPHLVPLGIVGLSVQNDERNAGCQLVCFIAVQRPPVHSDSELSSSAAEEDSSLLCLSVFCDESACTVLKVVASAMTVPSVGPHPYVPHCVSLALCSQESPSSALLVCGVSDVGNPRLCAWHVSNLLEGVTSARTFIAPSPHVNCVIDPPSLAANESFLVNPLDLYVMRSVSTHWQRSLAPPRETKDEDGRRHKQCKEN